MSKDRIRAANLRLLRHSVFNTDQTPFANTVGVAQSKLSRLERGKDSLDDELARQIEKSYNLPSEWMDRDNSDFFLSREEFELVKNIRELTLQQQKSVTTNFDGILKLIKPKL